MSKQHKLLSRLLSRPKNFTWFELVTLLNALGYETISGSGSRYKFVKLATKTIISLHKPHPGNIVKSYVVKDVIEKLNESGDIDV